MNGLITTKLTNSRKFVDSEKINEKKGKSRIFRSQPLPFKDEDPTSWLARFANSNFHSTSSLFRIEMDQKIQKSNVNWLIENLLYHEDLPFEFLRILEQRQDKVNVTEFLQPIKPFLKQSTHNKQVSNFIIRFITDDKIKKSSLYFPRYCPICFATDTIPYVRKSWRSPFYLICNTHHIWLRTKCPNCNSDFKYWLSKSILYCHKCMQTLSIEKEVNDHIKIHVSLQNEFIEFIKQTTDKSQIITKLYLSLINQNYHLNKELSFPKDTKEGYLLYEKAINQLLSEQAIFYCKRCEVNFQKLHIFKNHIYKSHSNKRPHSCLDMNCVKKFKTISDLNRHKMQVHLGLRKWICKKCNEKFKTKDHLLTHHLSHEKTRKFRCPKLRCKNAFKTKFNLNRHLTTKHSIKRPFHCKIIECHMSFKQQSDLNRHKNSVHQNQKNFKCKLDHCKESFSLKSYMQQHVGYVHTKSKTYHCNFKDCEKSFKRKGDMKRHEQTVHSNIHNYSCNIGNCDKSFKLRSDLKVHKTTVHKNIRPYHCSLNNCTKSFKRKSDLNAHIRVTHSTKRSYKCSKSNCSRSYKRKSELKRHIRNASDH